MSSSSEPESKIDSDAEASQTSSAGPDPQSIIKNNLSYRLDNVRYAGSFAAAHSSQWIIDPGIHVDQVGDISLPLTIGDAKALMTVGIQAPFGRGSDTVVDKSFRNTVELNPERFQLRNTAWPVALQEYIRRLGRELGFPDSPSGIKAELHKLLLYEEGAMFKAHTE